MKKNTKLRCHYCCDVFTKLTKDHKVSKAVLLKRKENGTLAKDFDFVSNIVLACDACNAVKRNLNYESFVALGVRMIRHKRDAYNKKVAANSSRKSKRYKGRKY